MTWRGQGSKGRTSGDPGTVPAAAAPSCSMCPPKPHTWPLLLASLQNRLGGQRMRPNHSAGEYSSRVSPWGLRAATRGRALLHWPPAQGIVLQNHSRHAQGELDKQSQELLFISEECWWGEELEKHRGPGLRAEGWGSFPTCRACDLGNSFPLCLDFLSLPGSNRLQ